VDEKEKVVEKKNIVDEIFEEASTFIKNSETWGETLAEKIDVEDFEYLFLHFKKYQLRKGKTYQNRGEVINHFSNYLFKLTSSVAQNYIDAQKRKIKKPNQAKSDVVGEKVVEQIRYRKLKNNILGWLLNQQVKDEAQVLKFRKMLEEFTQYFEGKELERIRFFIGKIDAAAQTTKFGGLSWFCQKYKDPKKLLRKVLSFKQETQEQEQSSKSYFQRLKDRWRV
jgi:hypothetical protein